MSKLWTVEQFSEFRVGSRDECACSVKFWSGLASVQFVHSKPFFFRFCIINLFSIAVSELMRNCFTLSRLTFFLSFFFSSFSSGCRLRYVFHKAEGLVQVVVQRNSLLNVMGQSYFSTIERYVLCKKYEFVRVYTCVRVLVSARVCVLRERERERERELELENFNTQG